MQRRQLVFTLDGLKDEKGRCLAYCDSLWNVKLRACACSAEVYRSMRPQENEKSDTAPSVARTSSLQQCNMQVSL
jgi:hypothetical protein